MRSNTFAVRRRSVIVGAAALGLTPLAWSRVPTISFDGEIYELRHAVLPQKGDRLQEFIRPGESLQAWTRLVGLRLQHVPGADPVALAVALQRTVLQNNPQAQAVVATNETRTEGLTDFLTWPADGSFLEFNVFRYAKPAGATGILSFQAAHRFYGQGDSGLGERIRLLRQSWLRQVLAQDMQRMHQQLMHGS